MGSFSLLINSMPSPYLFVLFFIRNYFVFISVMVDVMATFIYICSATEGSGKFSEIFRYSCGSFIL